MGGNRGVHGEAFGWKPQQRFETVSQGEAAERVLTKRCSSTIVMIRSGQARAPRPAHSSCPGGASNPLLAT